MKNRLIKLAFKLYTTYPKIASQLFKIAMPLVFDSDDPKENKPYELVYRIQNSKGQGFWQDPRSWSNLQDYNSFQNFETIKQSGATKYILIQEKLFGFASVAQAYKCIMPQQWILLNKNEFDLVPIKAKKIWSSGTQIFFEPFL